jgi:hypothetical protein
MRLATLTVMIKKIGRLFIIKTRLEAFAVIFALAMGATARGADYLESYPGFPGYLLFAACTAAVFMAGAKLLEATRPDNGRRRRRADLETRQAPDC